MLIYQTVKLTFNFALVILPSGMFGQKKLSPTFKLVRLVPIQ